MSDPILKRYYLDIMSTGIDVHIGLNDVPLLADPEGNGVRTVLPVNEWLAPGVNTITLRIAWPESKQHVPGKAELKVFLFEADLEQEFPEPKTVLAELVWPPAGAPELYPRKLEEPFKIEPALPTKLWEEAEPVAAVGNADQAAILALVEHLRRALLANDLDTALRLLNYRWQEDARANGLKLEELQTAVREQYTYMLSEPSPHSAPLDPEDASFILGADKRIVKVLGPNNDEAIVIETEEGRYHIPIYASKILGRWTIVR